MAVLEMREEGEGEANLNAVHAAKKEKKKKAADRKERRASAGPKTWGLDPSQKKAKEAEEEAKQQKPASAKERLAAARAEAVAAKAAVPDWQLPVHAADVFVVSKSKMPAAAAAVTGSGNSDKVQKLLFVDVGDRVDVVGCVPGGGGAHGGGGSLLKVRIVGHGEARRTAMASAGVDSTYPHPDPLPLQAEEGNLSLDEVAEDPNIRVLLAVGLVRAGCLEDGEDLHALVQLNTGEDGDDFELLAAAAAAAQVAVVGGEGGDASLPLADRSAGAGGGPAAAKKKKKAKKEGRGHRSASAPRPAPAEAAEAVADAAAAAAASSAPLPAETETKKKKKVELIFLLSRMVAALLSLSHFCRMPS
jgi:hypothetical protein